MARLTCDGSGAWLKSLAKWEELTEFRNREGAPHGGGGGCQLCPPRCRRWSDAGIFLRRRVEVEVVLNRRYRETQGAGKG